jgi:hypothetical protein
MTVRNYYYNKFLEWQEKGNGDYRTYLRRVSRQNLATEFNNDKNNGKGFDEVCNYLKIYARGQEKEQIMTVIEGIANPEKDIMEILIGATLDACGYTNTGNALIGLAIAGLIGAGLIALLGSLGKSR